MKNPVNRLDTLIRARYPLIAISSHEESRVEGFVAGLSRKQKSTAGDGNGGARTVSRAVVTWSLSQGLKLVEGDPLPSPPSGQDTEEPVAALRAILAWQETTRSEQPTTFVFRDLTNLFLGPDGAIVNPLVARLLRDVAREFPRSYHTLVLLAPGLRLPDELAKEAAYLDWPLPEPDDLRQIVGNLMDELPPDALRNLADDDSEQIVAALGGLTAIEAENALAAAVAATRRFDASCIPLIVEEKAAIVRKGGLLEYFDARVGYDQIGGLDLLKTYTRRRLACFSDAARAFGLSYPRGIILAGVPGSGKSLTAKAIAGGRLPLIRLDVGSLKGSLVGQSQANLRQALKVVDAVGQCVLWMDEADKAFSTVSGELDGGSTSDMLGILLTWMQERTSPAYIVATANRMTSLPPEFVRRFDDVFFVDLPSPAERREIFEIHLRLRNRAPDSFDLSPLVSATEGFTGDEIRKIVEAALTTAFSDGRPLAAADLLSAAAEIVPISQTAAADINAIREWGKANRARPASAPAPAESLPAPTANGRARRQIALEPT